MTTEGSHEDARLSASPQWERVEGEPFGDPNDIRDPRNVRPNSPIEGATHESLGVVPAGEEEVGGDTDSDETDNVEENDTASQDGTQTVQPRDTDYDLRHG